MTRSLKILLRSDLWEKGISYSRQHILRKIKKGQFPRPDGKVGDTLQSPNFWLEETIDNWVRARTQAYAITHTVPNIDSDPNSDSDTSTDIDSNSDTTDTCTSGRT